MFRRLTSSKCWYSRSLIKLVGIWCVLLVSGEASAANALTAPLQSLDEVAPNFLLRDVSGKELSLSDLHGRPVIVHFWATWCTSCRKELPSLDALASTLRADDVVFLAVSIDMEPSADEVRSYAHELGVSIPVYLAREGDVTDRYWTWGVPVTYLIDRSGRLVARALGPRNWQSAGILTRITRFAARRLSE